MNFIRIDECDMINGDGIRVLLWVSGCNNHCEECHNPESWDPTFGEPFGREAKEKVFKLVNEPYITGLTLTGGDPLYYGNRKEIAEFLKEFRQRCPGKDVWLWSGYTWEEVEANPDMFAVIKQVDVFVDGRFIKALYKYGLKHRGSTNQRVIDVKKTLEAGEIVLHYVDPPMEK